MNLTSIIKKIIGKETRTLKAVNNIFLSLIVKGVNVGIGFVMVPLTIHYLTKYKYGIWITLSELVGWFYLFDLGLGNGFRNKFAEALAKNDIKQARIFVSTTYFILGLISLSLFIIFIIINPFLPWTRILNCSPDLFNEISTLVVFIVGSFCMQFVLTLMKTILSADQKTAMGEVIDLSGKILSFSIVIILLNTTSNSLLYMGIGLSISPLLMSLLATFYFFNGKYKHVRPSYKLIHFESIKGIVNLGIKFFVIQLAGIIQYETSNIIITQLFGPAKVTLYSIPFKYFQIITLSFNIIATPLWSAFTEAWTKKDMDWIRVTIKRMNYIWFGFLFLAALMIFGSTVMYKVWLRKEYMVVPFSLTLTIGMYVLSKAFGTGYVFFLNGIGKVKLQFYFSIITAILNIPLSILFAKYLNMGLAGIVLSTWICSIYGALLGPFQYRKVMNGTAKGIWNK